jgi:hypothetical protein
MKRVTLPMPELFGIAATRTMLGAGVALMLSHRVERRRRRIVGAVLTTIGVLSTIPLGWDVLRRRKV